jgi:2-polyprenyl-3-methyl-5-hydroxy-6-metoxy-1,4-benzoquinol methylase
LRSVSFKKINASDVRNSFAEPFDVVICSEILEHLEKPETVLSTAYDVLGPHGLLIVTVPNGCGPFEASARLSAIVQNHRHVAELCRRLSPLLRSLSSDEVYEQSINVGEGSPHIRFFKKKALNELFQKTGFSVISSGSSDFISGTYPFSIVIRKSRLLCRLDFALADVLPSAMASGWYFTLQKDGVGLQKVAR